ncbi:MAG: hypothetical protein ABIT05_08730 [Chitinophagaceae bacterium]
MHFDKSLFIYLAIGFILATIIGTITHEFGHCLVATSLGYKAHINYASSWWTKSYPGQPISFSDSFLITLGGPLETMLTGTIGLICLFIFRRSFQKSTSLSFRQWVFIFIALFWLRQTVNYFVWISTYIFTGQFSDLTDEIHIANYLQLPGWTIPALTAVLGAIVLTIILLKFIPIKKRLTFIVSAVVGGVTGYITWFYFLGPKLMP